VRLGVVDGNKVEAVAADAVGGQPVSSPDAGLQSVAGRFDQHVVNQAVVLTEVVDGKSLEHGHPWVWVSGLTARQLYTQAAMAVKPGKRFRLLIIGLTLA
jgi:hypothetical protein